MNMKKMKNLKAPTMAASNAFARKLKSKNQAFIRKLK